MTRRPPAHRSAADTPEPPAVPEGATATLTVVAAEATYHVYPDVPRLEHVVVAVRDGKTIRVVEYPWDAWGHAARYVVGIAETSLRAAGRLNAATVYCGDCGAESPRDASGAAVCPTHGRP